MRHITSYFEEWTPEDVEHGEAGGRGEDEVVEFPGSEILAELSYEGFGSDSFSVKAMGAFLAVQYLADAGVEDESSSQFHKGVWYNAYGDADMRTGVRVNRSYHLKGYTEREERLVFHAMTMQRPPTGFESFHAMAERIP